MHCPSGSSKEPETRLSMLGVDLPLAHYGLGCTVEALLGPSVKALG